MSVNRIMHNYAQVKEFSQGVRGMVSQWDAHETVPFSVCSHILCYRILHSVVGFFIISYKTQILFPAYINTPRQQETGRLKEESGICIFR